MGGRSHVNDCMTHYKSWILTTLNGDGSSSLMVTKPTNITWGRSYKDLSHSCRTSLWRLKWPSEESVFGGWWLFWESMKPLEDEISWISKPGAVPGKKSCEASLWHQLSGESQDHIVSTWKADVAVLKGSVQLQLQNGKTQLLDDWNEKLGAFIYCI